jgi:glycosyltransferase involved in cell wall biosynthesis
MTVRTLLIGPRGHGGEGVYLESLYHYPPAGVEYELCGDFHRGSAGAPCSVVREMMLNQLVHRLTIPDMGFRALRLRRRFDLVHVHAHRVSLRRLDGTPLVMSEGSSSAVYLGEYLGWEPERLRHGYKRARRAYRGLGIYDRLLTLERVTRAYVFSNWARDVNLRWGADPDKLEVIYPGFPSPPPVERADREQFTFLFVGSDFERKGGFEVIEAFDRVVDQLPHGRLVLVGSDPERPNPDRLVHSWVPRARQERARMRLAELVRAGRVRQHRWLDQAQLREKVFPAADAFVMPTYAEGFGFTNVEAMSFGLPVITSNVGPAAEIVTENASGFLIEPGDVDALADAMLRIGRDATLAARMGASARREFERRFTRARFREALGDLYRRALEA